MTDAMTSSGDTPRGSAAAGQGVAAQQLPRRAPLWYYVRMLRRALPPGGRVLELCCAEGDLLPLLATDYSVLGYDPEPSARAQCRANVPDAVVLEDWLTVPDGSLSGVVLIRDAERWVPPLALLRRIADKLEPGGVVFLAAPNPAGFGRRRKGPLWFAAGESEDVRLPTQSEWILTVHRAGLQVTRVCGDGLWDPPYVRFLPIGLQRVLFAIPGAVQALWPWNRPRLPPSWGECVVLTARKPRNGKQQNNEQGALESL